MNTTRRWIAFCGLALLTAFAGVAQAAPQNGWWWNPAESGRGYFIEIAGTQVYMAGYFYESDGRATWLVSQGQITTPTSYQGRLLAFAGGQTLFGAYQPPGPATDVGAVSVQFTDDRHAILTWPGGSVSIERQTFGAGVASFQPLTGWWWNDAESGRGYSVEVQGDQLFLVGFMYDAAGNPLWYFAAGKMASATHFDGQILRFAGGQTMSGPYRPPGTPVVVGTVAVDFTAPDDATLTFTETVSPGLASSPVAKASGPIYFRIRPQLPRVPLSNVPDAWIGTVSEEVHTLYVAAGLREENKVTLSGAIIWVDDGPASPLKPPMGKAYTLAGTIRVNHVHTQTLEFAGCTSTMTPTDFPLLPSDGYLIVNQDGTYSGKIKRYDVPYVLILDCYLQVPGQPRLTYGVTENLLADLDVDMSGGIVYGKIRGAPKTITIGATTTTVTTKWDFVVKP